MRSYSLFSTSLPCKFLLLLLLLFLLLLISLFFHFCCNANTTHFLWLFLAVFCCFLLFLWTNFNVPLLFHFHSFWFCFSQRKFPLVFRRLLYAGRTTTPPCAVMFHTLFTQRTFRGLNDPHCSRVHCWQLAVGSWQGFFNAFNSPAATWRLVGWAVERAAASLINRKCTWAW